MPDFSNEQVQGISTSFVANEAFIQCYHTGAFDLESTFVF